MRNLRAGLQKQAAKYLVVALVAINGAGFYLAQEQLNRPYSGPEPDTSGTSATVADFSGSVPAMVSSDIAEPVMPYAATDAARDLGLDASPAPASMALSGTLPDLAALPPLRVEAAPVIPSVSLGAARLGRSEARAVRFRAARPQAERGFEATFLPDYEALAPYNGASETTGLTETAQDANAPVAGEVRSEAISMDSTAAPSPAAEAVSAEAMAAPAAQDISAPVAELPSVDVAVKIESLPG